jgi:hypothetical protein
MPNHPKNSSKPHLPLLTPITLLLLLSSTNFLTFFHHFSISPNLKHTIILNFSSCRGDLLFLFTLIFGSFDSEDLDAGDEGVVMLITDCLALLREEAVVMESATFFILVWNSAFF